MSALNGVVEDDQDEAPPEPRKTVDERLWKAFEHPLRRHQIRRLAAAMPGGTEGQADRYLDRCVEGGSVVVVHGRAGSAAAVYQRADKAGAKTATPAKTKAAPRPAIVEAEEGPLEDEDDETDEDIPELGDDQDDDNEAPRAPVRRTRTMAKTGDVREAILAAMRDGFSTTAAILEATGRGAHVGNVLGAMAAAGEIVRVGRGNYVLPGKAATRPSPAVTKTPKPKSAPAKAARKPAVRAVTKGADDFDALLADVIEKKAAFDTAKARLVAAAGGAS